MSSFFGNDDSDEDETSFDTRAMPPPPPTRRYTDNDQARRQASVSGISESSRAESSRQAGRGEDGRSRSYASNSRFEATLSPRSDSGRVSDSLPQESDDMSSMNGTSHFGFPGARNGRGHTRGASESTLGSRMDVDLLAEAGSGREVGEEEEELEGDMNDVRRLGLVWVRERGTGDIMRWEGDLIDSIFDKLEQQQKMVDTLRSDPQTSEEEHFKLVLVMTEMERVKFLVRSYVRTRLWKIEKYSQWIVATPEIHLLLSGAEMAHARRYTELLHTHFQHSVLDSLPEWLRKMDDSYSDGLSMVAKPNKSMPVLIYCRRDCGEVALPDGDSAALTRGSTHLVKYNLVEQWIKLGWAEVL